jgi:electron transfer flavoprotein alpha subunit
VTDTRLDERGDAMATRTWLVVADSAAIGNLITMARSIGGQVVAVVAGPREVAGKVAESGVDRLLWLGDPGPQPSEAFAAPVAELVAAGAPTVILGADRSPDRALLGAVAARLGAPVLTGMSQVDVHGPATVLTRTMFGGIALQTCSVTGPLALVLDGGSTVRGGSAVPIEECAAESHGVRVVETVASTTERVDLSAAPRVVGVGRGVKAREDLELIESLAAALRAEIACTRPLAEGVDWLPKDRYVGVSGQTIAPDLYVAVGISGQLQHVVGVRQAKTIVAINTDADAPVFAVADYGIVGDLYQIVPALVAALGGAAEGA